MKKILALGNILLSDDGVAVYLSEHLKGDFERLGYSVFKCETDTGYAISVIEESDEMIILDASFTGGDGGDVKSMTLQEYRDNYYKREGYGHNSTIFDYIFLEGKRYKGNVILVEVCSLEIFSGLSEIIGERLPVISERVLEEVKKISMG